jgi:tetratricopeptide (TPR) repeat protein
MLQHGWYVWPLKFRSMSGAAMLLMFLATASLAREPDPIPPTGPAAAEPTPVTEQPTSEPVPAEPVPAEPVPAEPVPAEPVPSEPVPAEPVPSEPLPAEPVPAEPVPSEPVPAEPVPAEPVPAEPVPAEPVPAEPVPVEPGPADPMPTKPMPSNAPSTEETEAPVVDKSEMPDLRFHEGAPREVIRLREPPADVSPNPEFDSGSDASPPATSPDATATGPSTGPTQKSPSDAQPEPLDPERRPAPPADLQEPDDAVALPDLGLLENIHPASFQQITPGKTSLSELVAAMGKPAARKNVTGGERLEYQVGPFPKVVFQIVSDRVSAVVIHLKELTPVAEVSDDLELGDLRSVVIPGQLGQRLGVSYPERGLQLLFAEGQIEPRVSHVVLESVSAEPFILRAVNTPRNQLQDRMSDLAVARHLAGNDRETCYLRARVLMDVECFDQARQVIRQAGTRQSETRLRLIAAKLLAKEGKYEDALAETRAVAQADETEALVKARAECQLGDLLVDSPKNDFNQAIQYHLSAIKRATPLLKDPSLETRRAAREILIDAHLSGANDVAWGNWQNKVEAVSRWLENAEKHATAYADQQPEDPALRLLVLRETLSAYAGTVGAFDPTDAVASVLLQGQRALEQTNAPEVQQHLHRLIGKCLMDAVQIAHVRRDYRQAGIWGTAAASHLEALEHSQTLTWTDHELVGRLYFLRGFGHVLDKSAHDKAVVWYERALPHLQSPLPADVARDAAHQGQHLVTMAVSYWETGAHDEALMLTERGMKLMEQAVEQGKLPRPALVVPYGNLASMYQELGNQEQATAMTARAREVEPPKVKR